ncbi:hypothetical protein RCC89_13835 [Cytophagaceae bacterium ABcell3]|nr:hypothetical protein RCC89_13835 [Cytophagaceae bacterium ABcell3]
MKNTILLLFCSIIFCSCGSTPEIEGFSKEAWANDIKGCNNHRGDLVKLLLENKESLKGVSDKNLFKLLGKPDMQRYYERGKKSYLYFYEPGDQCDDASGQKNGKRIAFEVNSLGVVVLITEEIR